MGDHIGQVLHMVTIQYVHYDLCLFLVATSSWTVYKREKEKFKLLKNKICYLLLLRSIRKQRIKQ